MLTIKSQKKIQNAREYFREHLCIGDYYSEQHKMTGEWFGLGAEKLGLNGFVQEEPFLSLCEGLDPNTQKRLTLRQNTERRENGQMVANRRILYDFTISPPKSVSIIALLQDDRIVRLHNESVRSAMREIEAFASAQLHKGSAHGVRTTGNVTGAMFRHETSRELDPHLHTHCIVFNATFDQAEQRWKALESSAMYRAQKFAENVYYHELCQGLHALGYEIEPAKYGFEIKGVPQSVVQRFSKRHEQIDIETQKVQANYSGNVHDLREQIARSSRKHKANSATAGQLCPDWLKQLSLDEKAALGSLKSVRASVSALRADAAQLVAWADAHLFERRSVVFEHELLSAALARGRGQNVSVDELRKAIEARHYARQIGTDKLTSQEALQCELDIVLTAEKGRSRHLPFNPRYDGASALSEEQRAAVKQILNSRDFITLFCGRAGTGKSFALKEVNSGLAAAGQSVVVVAPQRQQVIDLEKDGLRAQTLSQLLAVQRLPRQAVVIVDEAGQVGGKDLHALIHLVQAHDGRLILSGDTRQHGAVPASDALRAIEKHSGLTPAEIRTIRRQDPALGKSREERTFIRQYRQAVKLASNGEALESFDQLDRLGCVRELPASDRHKTLAKEYVATTQHNDSVLVVAQTWDEVHAVNDAIRDELNKTGKLSDDHPLTTYRAIDSTDAQKHDPHFYQPGRSVYFLRRYSRYAKGDVYAVVGASDHGISLMKDGRTATISYRYADRLAIVETVSMPVTKGDRLQLKFNGRSVEGHTLANGELVTVQSLLRDGALVVTNDSGVTKTLSATQRLFNRGYAVTSYASQGKTVDRVLISDSANPAATNLNQWYVAISRGRKSATIFTSDKTQLRTAVTQSGNRELAIELGSSDGAACSPQPAWVQRAWENIRRLKQRQWVQPQLHQQTQQHRVRL